jgi:hypothetical protein
MKLSEVLKWYKKQKQNGLSDKQIENLFIKYCSINLKSNEMKTNVQNYKGVKNQLIIKTDQGTFFQSYNSVIAFTPADGSKTQLDKKYWDYSQTTRRYRNLFLNKTSKQIRDEIKTGEIILTDLNG